jgi:hypothetical protein
MSRCTRKFEFKEYIFAGRNNMEAKIGVTILYEDCTVLGVTFDPALDCGLYLLAVSTRLF